MVDFLYFVLSSMPSKMIKGRFSAGSGSRFPNTEKELQSRSGVFLKLRFGSDIFLSLEYESGVIVIIDKNFHFFLKLGFGSEYYF